MTRKDVEVYLRANGKAFHHLCCIEVSHNAYDTLVEIGKERAPWYCSDRVVYIGFTFASEGSHKIPEARDSDVLTGVRVFKRLTGCL